MRKSPNLTAGDIRWRNWLIALALLSLATLVMDVATNKMFYGGLGLQSAPSGRPLIQRVVLVDAGSPAARAGLHVGTLIDTRAFSSAERYRWYTGPFIRGERVHVPVLRGNTVRNVVVAATWHTALWDVWVFYAGNLWQLLFALLLAWRRPESKESRVLCLWLIIGGAAVDLNASNSPLPSLALEIPLNIVAALLSALAAPLLAVYAMLFARPASPARRALASLSYLSAVASCGYALAQLAAAWSGFADPTGPALNGVATNCLWELENVFPLLCAFAAIAAARGAERGRIVWTTLTVGLIYAANLSNALEMLPQFSSGAGLHALFIAGNISFFLAPLGMTYALLNRRLLDVGFAFNRATIFAGVSFVLIGAFVLVEWLLSGWLQTASHSANIIVSAVLALVLGFSIRFVHARVEHFVDNVLFRKRREDEEAIRRLAREAPYITEGGVLLDRVTAVLSAHADAAFVRILLDDGAGAYGGVNENDPALVALRAKHDVLDLHTVETSIAGEFAYPMVARGRLVGTLVLGPKRSGESYAPDESSAIEQLAHSVAAALDVLAFTRSREEGRSIDALEREVREMRRTLRALAEHAGVAEPA